MLQRKETNLNYVQDIDFAQHRDDISEIVAGNQPIANLAGILNQHTADDWVQEAGPASTKGATITYFGPNKKSYPTRSNYAEVCIVKMGKKDNVKFAGANIYLMIGRK